MYHTLLWIHVSKEGHLVPPGPWTERRPRSRCAPGALRGAVWRENPPHGWLVGRPQNDRSTWRECFDASLACEKLGALCGRTYPLVVSSHEGHEE